MRHLFPIIFAAALLAQDGVNPEPPKSPTIPDAVQQNYFDAFAEVADAQLAVELAQARSNMAFAARKKKLIEQRIIAACGATHAATQSAPGNPITCVPKPPETATAKPSRPQPKKEKP